MPSGTGGILRAAFQDLAGSWRTLALADLAYKALAFAILTPATALFLRWLLSRTGSRVAADVDIARFFFTTPEGIVALIAGSAITAAITALEVSCLIAIAFSASRGSKLTSRSALLYAAEHAPAVLRLALQMVIRVLAGIVPFVLAIGVVYLAFLSTHDINYFLAQKPPAFWAAVSLAGIIGAGLVALILQTIARWAFALPILMLESSTPRQALRESSRRSKGRRGQTLLVLGVWAAIAGALGSLSAWFISVLARAVAPQLAGSVSALLLFFTLLIALWGLLAVAIAVFNVSLFSVLIVRLWNASGQTDSISLPSFDSPAFATRRASRTVALALGAAGLLIAAGFASIVFFVTRKNEPVMIIAHRGASLEAPENSLAAFRLAMDQSADFIELDVQETADGEVVVVHDSDLMKVAGSSRKIWEQTAVEIRAVDIGSYRGAQFRDERVPTLAEALETARGRARVMIELKTYGHNQRLEERVVEIVEAAGMASSCSYMSLDHDTARRIKHLRPKWRVGMLLAKAVGDPTTLDADFIAVEARMATARFVHRAHRSGKEVYVWTVNDPAWMLAVLSRGVDGVITDKPALAREVVSRRASLSDAQRMLLALLIRAGATPKALESEAALRP